MIPFIHAAGGTGLRSLKSGHGNFGTQSQILALARCFAAPPGTPAEQVAALRAAFDATMKDPEFLETASKQGLEISPMTGAEVQNTIKQVLAAPKGLREQVKAAMGVN